jgi:hypothetical protein
MLRETSAASTIAASTATGAPAALARGAWITMSESITATQGARLIRKPLRIKASYAPPQKKHRAAEGDPEGARAAVTWI